MNHSGCHSEGGQGAGGEEEGGREDREMGGIQWGTTRKGSTPSVSGAAGATQTIRDLINYSVREYAKRPSNTRH